MPAIGNPHGEPMTEADRSALSSHDVHVVEDDAYAELRFDGTVARPLVADGRAHVWHVGSFSKTLCPGLRVGWLVPPRAWRWRATETKHASDLQASSLGQTILELFLERDDFDERLARARRFYRARAARLLRAVRRHLPGWRCREPEGGFALFLQSDEPGDDLELLEIATRHGMSFDPGRTFRPDHASSPLALRICFSNARAHDLDEGARRLAGAWDEYRRLRDRALPARDTSGERRRS
jgi:2-aminoadipate transaminase